MTTVEKSERLSERVADAAHEADAAEKYLEANVAHAAYFLLSNLFVAVAYYSSVAVHPDQHHPEKLWQLAQILKRTYP